MSRESIWDVLIIGAGAAGLTAGIVAARKKKKVLILEGGDQPGKKLLITGGGHCNISNREVTEKDYQTGQPRTVRNVIRAFPPRDAEKFFQEIGVGLVEKEDGNLFPATDSAKTVLGAFLDEANRCGVRIEKMRKVRQIEPKGGDFFVSVDGFSYRAHTVILATGGLSYPETGSDGAGYALARTLGHSVTDVVPALVPLKLDNEAWNSLTGITLPAELSLIVDGKKIATTKGPLLFTHTGLSGPSILDLSRHCLFNGGRCLITVNFLPGFKAERFLEEIEEVIETQPALSLKKMLTRYFPERLAAVLIQKVDLDPQLQMAHCSKEVRQRLLGTVFSLPLAVTGSFGYEKAEATAGGIDLAEVDSKTLESKKHPGLFFAGEVLDVDGRVGGFNLHWAWASGFVTGNAASQKR